MPIPASSVLAAENRPQTVILIAPDGTPYAGAFTASVAPVTYTNRSGALTTGGAAQTVAPANAARRGYFVQNVSAGDLWISTETTAVLNQPSIKLIANAFYESPVGLPPGGAISIIGATTGQAFTAREY
jgi:hypothetical protein